MDVFAIIFKLTMSSKLSLNSRMKKWFAVTSAQPVALGPVAHCWDSYFISNGACLCQKKGDSFLQGLLQNETSEKQPNCF